MTTGKNKNKQEIEAIIPHSGKMCLIEQVDWWDIDNITCRTNSHRDLQNPLRLNGELSAIHLLEYGAQAIAIHGGLLTNAKIPGFLAAIRNTKLHIARIDTLDCEITINAKAEIKTENGAVYEFSISAADEVLIEARATVINS
jgi:predicted hotdog family 3-hydroxylacyl-ACP dehydratase